MSRFIRKTAILAKIQPTPLTDSVPTGAANAILVSNVTINQLNAQLVDRDLVRPYLGGSEQLVGTSFAEVGFDVELAGSGAAGTAPAWGPLVRGCGMAETITAGQYAEYNPITDAQEALTIYYHLDGVLHKLTDAKGTFDLKAGIGTKPVLSFKFTGLGGVVSAVANPSTTLTAWKTPLAINDANTGDILLGCTYAAGALSAGTLYPSGGLDVSLGNTVNHTPLLGGEAVDITARTSTGKMQLDLSAAQHVSFMTDIKAVTLTSLGLAHGTTTGHKIVVYAPAVQRINPEYADKNGRALVGMDLRLLPVSGNDELRLVAL